MQEMGPPHNYVGPAARAALEAKETADKSIEQMKGEKATKGEHAKIQFRSPEDSVLQAAAMGFQMKQDAALKNLAGREARRLPEKREDEKRQSHREQRTGSREQRTARGGERAEAGR